MRDWMAANGGIAAPTLVRADGWRTGRITHKGARWEPAELGAVVDRLIAEAPRPQKVYGSRSIGAAGAASPRGRAAGARRAGGCGNLRSTQVCPRAVEERRPPARLATTAP